MPSSKNPQIYVSRLSRRVSKDDLADAFKQFGKIREILLKNGFAFIVKKTKNFQTRFFFYKK